VGLFCAGKKDGSLRLIVDGREPSSFHRRPPHSALGAPAGVYGSVGSGLQRRRC
jgi:hypothetical protein